MAREIGNGLNLKGQKITNLGDGSLASDAATWGQVQAFLAGLAWKASVRAASTGNVSLAAPGASIDGVALSANDRVLLKNQTAPAENGIYVWQASGTALTRSGDMDVAAETQSATVLVREGTANADTGWTQTADGVTLGTTALTFVQFAAGASSYTAGNGLQLSGGAFSVKIPAGAGIIVDGTGVYIDTAVVVRKFAVTIGDGTATSFTITHNLNTRDVQVTIFDVGTNAEILTDVVHATVNTATVAFAVAPTAGQYRVVVQG